VHGKVWKSATSVGLRAPAGRFDATKGGSIDTGDGRRVASSSPGRGPWTAGGLGEMPGDAEEGIGIEMLPFVLSLKVFLVWKLTCPFKSRYCFALCIWLSCNLGGKSLDLT